MLGHLLYKVHHFRIHGVIDTKQVQTVQKTIQKLNLIKPQLIAVSIDSRSGSLVQAKNLAMTFQNYSNQTGAPVYCFAEDVVMGSAMLLLCSGNKCFANKYTIFGDLGFTRNSFGLKNFAEKWDFELKYIHAGKNKVKLNKYEDLKQEDVEWITNVLKQKEYNLRQEILRFRTDQIFDKKTTSSDVENNVFSKSIFTSKVALSNGLIDGLESLDDIVHERFHGTKVVDVLNQGFFGQMKQEIYESQDTQVITEF